MLNLHANVFARPTNVGQGAGITLRSVPLTTLTAAGGQPLSLTDTLTVSFETMQQRLKTIARSDVEPDGFFLVTGGKHETFWRLNGHMHEFNDGLHRIELNGACPADTLDSVLRAMGWPETPLVFQLVMEGVTLDEQNFRRWAQSSI